MKKKILISVLIIMIGIPIIGFSAGALFVNYIINSSYDQMVTTDKVGKDELSVTDQVLNREEETQVINIALFGVDQNEDQSAGRSDAMKIISLDGKNNTAKITSIQRDTLIYIPGDIQDFDKLNHAYAYGGANLAIQTLNYNFDLDLNRYVSFNYDAIEKIIDAIGGVYIEVLEKEVPHITGVSSSGWQRLNGAQAMGYMRVRYADSDYVRMERQTNVIKAVFSEINSLSYTELLSLLNECLPYIETNISKDEIIKLGLQALKVDFGNIEQYQIPKNGYDDINQIVSYKGYSPLYVMNSYQEMVQQLHQGIYGKDGYEPSAIVKDTEDKIYDTFNYIEK